MTLAWVRVQPSTGPCVGLMASLTTTVVSYITPSATMTTSRLHTKEDVMGIQRIPSDLFRSCEPLLPVPVESPSTSSCGVPFYQFLWSPVLPVPVSPIDQLL
nr:uncharacterized protein LOC123774436 isoform X1 [Procambarus clarkii]